MKTIKGPAIFLAQFMGEAPFHTLDSACKTMAGFGYKAVQLPTWDSRVMSLELAATSKTYADELKGKIAAHGLQISELSTHLQGQLVAIHPAYNTLFDSFAPSELHGNLKGKQAWATQQLKWAAQASANLGLTAHATFSGALAWPYVYPWPQRPAGLIDEAFGELAKRWLPILDEFDGYGVDACFELHPGEDLHDGLTFERFLALVGNHNRATILYDPSHFVLQQLDYLQFIDFYADRIRMFHVKDSEFNPTGKSGVYGGYADWADRAGRFRSLGDGQTDFKAIFSKLAQANYNGWAVVEWECCIKDAMQGAAEGAPFVANQIITVVKSAFDNFAGGKADKENNRRILGL